MCHSLLADASFWRHLQLLDEQLAAQARRAGCPHCQGVLHGARYPRKVFGVARSVLGEGYAHRLRIPLNLDTRSGVNVDTDSGQSDHESERSDAGVGL